MTGSCTGRRSLKDGRNLFCNNCNRTTTSNFRKDDDTFMTINSLHKCVIPTKSFSNKNTAMNSSLSFRVLQIVGLLWVYETESIFLKVS
jgi:hypothetical protein